MMNGLFSDEFTRPNAGRTKRTSKVRGRAIALSAATLTMLTPIMLGVQPQSAQAAGFAPASVTGQPTAVSVPLTEPVRALAQTHGISPEGEPQAYWVVDGKVSAGVTATLQVTDVRTGNLMHVENIPSGYESYAIHYSPADSNVYAAMTDGSWYRWSQTEETLTRLPDLSEANPDLNDHAIWAITTGSDGNLYVGTNNGAHLLRLDLASDELEYLDITLAGENAVRALTTVDDSVYIGTESRAGFIRYDIAEESFNRVPLPSDVTGQRGIMTMSTAGDLVLMRARPSSSLLAFSHSQQAFVASYPNVDGVASMADPTGSFFIYYDTVVGMIQVDLTTLEATVLGNRPSATPQSWAFVEMPGSDWPGYSVSFTFQRGRNYVNNYETKVGLTWMDDKLQAIANTIQGIGVDNSSNLYIGGDAANGMLGTYDALSGRTSQMSVPGGAHQIKAWEDRLIYADATTGQVRVFDPNAPIVNNQNPSAPLTVRSQQTLILDVEPIDDTTVAIATAPTGDTRTAGALTLWDTTSAASPPFYRGLAGNRSITSIETQDHYLVGTTSIHSLPGQSPAVSEAVIFTYDLAARGGTMHAELTLDGTVGVIGGLTQDQTGKFWAVADGDIVGFTIDANGQIDLVNTIPLNGTVDSRYAEGWQIVVNATTLWANIEGQLWQMPLDSLTPEELPVSDASNLTLAADGNLYYARGHELMRFKVEGGIDVTAPSEIPAFSGERISGNAVSMGAPVEQIGTLGGAVTTDPDGTNIVFGITNGSPGKLNKINANTGELIWSQDLEGVGGSYSALVDDKGDLYVSPTSTSTGYIFRVKAGSEVVESVVRPAPGETFLWDIALGDNGVIYGSTFPNGKLWSFDTNTEVSRDYGNLIPGSMQGRSVTYHDGTAYVGFMNPVAIVAVDVESGDNRLVDLPEAIDADDPMQGVFDIDARDGIMYTRIGTDIKAAPLFAYDLQAEEWLDFHVPDVSGLGMPIRDPNPSTSDDLYIMSNARLQKMDPHTGQLEDTSLRYRGIAANYRGLGWLDLNDPEWPGLTLTGLFQNGEIWRYNPITGNHYLQPTDEVQIVGSTALILHLEPAARGGVWLGAYLAGFAHADLDAGTGAPGSAQHFGGSQTETLYDDGETLWLGLYPDSRISSGPNDIAAPRQQVAWSMIEASGIEQDRQPGVDVNDRWVVGATGPKLTNFGGSLGVIDRTTCGSATNSSGGTLISESNCEFTKHDGLSPDRGFTSVALNGDVAYATSWILGGTGAPTPPQSEGQVIAFDLDEQEVKWAVSPVGGVKSYVGATLDLDGNVWALGETSVVQLDAETGRTLRIITLPGTVNVVSQTFPALVGVMDRVPGTDRLLVKVSGSLYEINAGTGDVTNHGPAGYRAMAVSDAGLVFFSNGPELFKWQLPGMDVQTLKISTDAPEVGEVLKLNLEGFQADEEVIITATPQLAVQAANDGELMAFAASADTELISLTVDRTGSTGARLELPELTGGEYQLVAQGVSSQSIATADISVPESSIPGDGDDGDGDDGNGDDGNGEGGNGDDGTGGTGGDDGDAGAGDGDNGDSDGDGTGGGSDSDGTGGNADGSVDGDGLAATGVNTSNYLWIVALLLLMGAGAVAAVRYERTSVSGDSTSL